MASAEVYRTSESNYGKLFQQENGDIGSCHRSVSSASGSSIEKFFLQENSDSISCHSKDFSVSSPEGSIANMIHAERTFTESATKSSNCIIRVPRCDDQTLREKIRVARLLIEEKTKLRDTIQVQVQEKRANSQIHGLDYEYAKGEERSAQNLVKSKRMEIDHLLSVINKAKNALAIKDVDSQISNMEHMMQHENFILGKEKQLIREIKQLKLLREQLSPSLGDADEIQQALKRREAAEKRVKFLRKELSILKDSISKAEAAAWQAGKKFSDENKKLKELQLQLRAANGDLQVAYSQWQSLWNELCNKCEDDTTVASNCACSRNREALHPVENIAELWNMNEELQQEDVKFSAGSTVGHIKSPASYVHENGDGMDSSAAKAICLSQNPSQEPKQEATVGQVISGDKLIRKVTDAADQTVIDDQPPGSVSGNSLFMVSSQDTAEEVLSDDEHEAKLKEKCRLEEVAKANEVRERKKQQAKKIQVRKEMKAQKEAEQKEKKREKRSRKKENQKIAATATDGNDTNSIRTCTAAETSNCMPSAEPKMPPQKTHCTFTKRISKVRSIPPPLRNRNKKMYRRWMWTCLISLVLSIILWHGTVDVFTSAKLNLE